MSVLAGTPDLEKARALPVAMPLENRAAHHDLRDMTQSDPKTP
jgi:hypothetical protein